MLRARDAATGERWVVFGPAPEGAGSGQGEGNDAFGLSTTRDEVAGEDAAVALDGMLSALERDAGAEGELRCWESRASSVVEGVEPLVGRPAAGCLGDAWAVYAGVFGETCPEVLPAVLDLLAEEVSYYALVTGKAYREHLAHSVRVMLAGRRILELAGSRARLNELLWRWLWRQTRFWKALGGRALVAFADRGAYEDGEGGRTPLRYVRRLRDNALRQERILRVAWLVASLFHDFGYPQSMATQSSRRRAHQLSPFTAVSRLRRTPEFSDSLEESLLLLDLRSRATGYGKTQDLFDLIEQSPGRNHSLGAAVIVLHLLHLLLARVAAARDSSDAAKDAVIDLALAFELAAHAISLHDLDSAEKRAGMRGQMSLSAAPLAWLLRAIDLIQEWDRPLLARVGGYAAPPSAPLVTPVRAVVLVVSGPDEGGEVTRYYRAASEELSDGRIRPDWFCDAGRELGPAAPLDPRPREPLPGGCPLALRKVEVGDSASGQIWKGDLLECDGGLGGPPASAATATPAARPAEPHPRCFQVGWTRDLDEFLRTGRNAEDLASLLLGGPWPAL
ncbi:MAG: hypothetical protein HY744_06065 [Deltaproteobacteria bacterium]|nr:hypothetical protein [Deltaproteobacteria bacterium]